MLDTENSTVLFISSVGAIKLSSENSFENTSFIDESEKKRNSILSSRAKKRYCKADK